MGKTELVYLGEEYLEAIESTDKKVLDRLFVGFQDRCEDDSISVGDVFAYGVAGAFMESLTRNIVGDEVYEVPVDDGMDMSVFKEVATKVKKYFEKNTKEYVEKDSD